MSNSKDTDQPSSHDDEYQYPSSEGVSDYDISEDEIDETLEIQDPAQSRMQQLVQKYSGDLGEYVYSCSKRCAGFMCATGGSCAACLYYIL